MTPTPDLHVIFGSGPLGQAVLRELLKRGRRVRVVNRRGELHPVLPGAYDAVEVVRADADDPAAAQAAAHGAAVVYQCAQPEYHAWVDKFPPLQTSILDAAATAGAKLIVGDNLYMYGEVSGAIHEGLPNAAHTRKGRLRAQLAEAVLTAHHAGRVRVAIGRGSDFYGPGVLGSSLGDRFFAPIAAGKPAEVLGDLTAPHTYTFIDDFGTALVNLGEHDAALGQVWHVPNAPTVSHAQIVALLESIIGRPIPVRTASKLFIRFGGLFVPAARELVEMFYEFDRPFLVDDRKYKAAFGDHSTPLRAGLAQTVAWYAAQ